jgi:HK97 family phage major capsid protein
MPHTIEDIIISQEASLELEKRNRDRSFAEIRSILARAKDEGRASLTEQEDQDVEGARQRAARADDSIKGLEHQLEISRRTKASELAVDQHLREKNPTSSGAPESRNRPAYDQVARIGQEERTYHRGNTGKGGAFIRDIAMRAVYGDIEAEQRLIRHMQEERVERGAKLTRAAGTGAFAGLTVPQYLTDMYAPAIAALRPFADVCNQHDLPDNGMTVNISRITTSTAVALQATENTAVTNQDIDDTLLTVNVQTAAGQQTLSRQAIERGTGVEGIVMDDLFRRYATTLDSTLINQATTGLSASGTSVPYVDASPTAAELWPKLLGAASGVEQALLGMGNADVAVMHSRRWYWFQSQLTTAWPLISQGGFGQGPGGALGTANQEQYGRGARGVLPTGMVVVTDNNIPTTKGGGTEDEIYVISSQECHLWEDPSAPVFIRAEQPAAGSLGIQLVLYGYFAYTFGRYANAVQSIGGTGMIAPTF